MTDVHQIMMTHKKYDYKDMRIPVEQFTAEGGYYLKLNTLLAINGYPFSSFVQAAGARLSFLTISPLYIIYFTQKNLLLQHISPKYF